MLCNECRSKTATVHLTQISGDKIVKRDFCDDCAKAKGVNDPAGFSIAGLMTGLSSEPRTAPHPRFN